MPQSILSLVRLTKWPGSEVSRNQIKHFIGGLEPQDLFNLFYAAKMGRIRAIAAEQLKFGTAEEIQLRIKAMRRVLFRQHSSEVMAMSFNTSLDRMIHQKLLIEMELNELQKMTYEQLDLLLKTDTYYSKKLLKTVLKSKQPDQHEITGTGVDSWRFQN